MVDATVKSQPQTHSALLGLPPELRNRIYEHIFYIEPTSDENGYSYVPISRDEQVLSEAEGIFYAINQVGYHAIAYYDDPYSDADPWTFLTFIVGGLAHLKAIARLPKLRNFYVRPFEWMNEREDWIQLEDSAQGRELIACVAKAKKLEKFGIILPRYLEARVPRAGFLDPFEATVQRAINKRNGIA